MVLIWLGLIPSSCKFLVIYFEPRSPRSSPENAVNMMDLRDAGAWPSCTRRAKYFAAMMTPAVPEALSSAPLWIMSPPSSIFSLWRDPWTWCPSCDWPRWS